MKILKISNNIRTAQAQTYQIIDQKLFDFFKSALPKINWSDGNNRDFVYKKEVDGFLVYKTTRWASVHNPNLGYTTPDFMAEITLWKKANSPTQLAVEIKKANGYRIFRFNSPPTEDAFENEKTVSFLSAIGLKDIKDLAKEETDTLTPTFIDNKPVYAYKRFTLRQTVRNAAESLEIWIEKAPGTGNTTLSLYNSVLRKTDLKENIKKIFLNSKEAPFAAALQSIEGLEQKARANKYVDENSLDYIPVGANAENWDFDSNYPITQKGKPKMEISLPKRPNIDLTPKSTPDTQIDINDIEIASGEVFLKRFSQAKYDFGGYYSGDVPDPSSFVGSSSVEASQIKSAFNGADQAIQMVNSFNPSLLKNIAFIFNFNKSGAYGVYLSELDRAIKTEVLKKKLEQQGYTIGEENGMLTAFPTKDSIPQDQIEKDIDTLYSGINQGGGTAIGINVGECLAAARENANSLQSPDPDFLFQQLAILHVGGTIVHEATHAHGHMDEGPAEQAEATFTNWVLPKINKNYLDHLRSMGREAEFQEIIVGTTKRHANSNNWYRAAQSYLTPFEPVGSDLSGRMQGKFESPMGGRADYSMIFNQMSHESIEKRLGRQFMWPLAQDIDPDKDSTEEQLRKTFFEQHNDPNASTEELLQKDRALESEIYKSIQEKLQDSRPAPLMQTLKAKAAMAKTAIAFGYMNGLETDGGNNIGSWLPQPEDRVIAWDDREGLFQYEEDTGRGQDEGGKNPRMEPRYNPELKNGVNTWIYEPRNAPQEWSEINRDNVNTHPAKRFGSNEMEIPSDTLGEIEKVLCAAKSDISSGKKRAARFLVSDDIMDLFSQASQGLKTAFFKMEDSEEELWAAWMTVAEVAEDDIEVAERYFHGDTACKKQATELLNLPDANRFLNEILEGLKKIAMSEQLDDIFLVGESARELFYNENISGSTFRFCCEDRDSAATYGQILAEGLGREYDYDNSGDLFIVFGPFAVFFHCGENEGICEQLVRLGADEEDMLDGVKCELSNKDLTINMVAMNILDKTLFDPYNVIGDIQSKTLKTRYNAASVIALNPSIIAKIIRLMNEGYEPEMELQYLVENNIGKLKELGKEVMASTRLLFQKNRINLQD